MPVQEFNAAFNHFVTAGRLKDAPPSLIEALCQERATLHADCRQLTSGLPAEVDALATASQSRMMAMLDAVVNAPEMLDCDETPEWYFAMADLNYNFTWRFGAKVVPWLAPRDVLRWVADQPPTDVDAMQDWINSNPPPPLAD